MNLLDDEVKFEDDPAAGDGSMRVPDAIVLWAAPHKER
jgi:hypothetical protein